MAGGLLLNGPGIQIFPDLFPPLSLCDTFSINHFHTSNRTRETFETVQWSSSSPGGGHTAAQPGDDDDDDDLRMEMGPQGAKKGLKCFDETLRTIRHSYSRQCRSPGPLPATS